MDFYDPTDGPYLAHAIWTREADNLFLFYSLNLVVVDCAEGTTRQFELQPSHPPALYKVRRGKVNTIFVTHMHGKRDRAVRLDWQSLTSFLCKES